MNLGNIVLGGVVALLVLGVVVFVEAQTQPGDGTDNPQPYVNATLINIKVIGDVRTVEVESYKKIWQRSVIRIVRWVYRYEIGGEMRLRLAWRRYSPFLNNTEVREQIYEDTMEELRYVEKIYNNMTESRNPDLALEDVNVTTAGIA